MRRSATHGHERVTDAHADPARRSYLTWGVMGGSRVYAVVADDPAGINESVEEFARAAAHACYPDCH